MPRRNYYDDASALITAYLGCTPEKRILFVRESIGSEYEDLDLNKLYKMLDAIFITIEKARGQLASQLALAKGTTASAVQLALFDTSDRRERLNAWFVPQMGGTEEEHA